MCCSLGKRFLVFVLLAILRLEAKHAISYEGGDRFGDRLLVYAQARYLAYLTEIPFLYRPFPYSECITAEHQSHPFDRYKVLCRTVEHLQSAESFREFFRKIRDPTAPSTLFVVEYFPSDISEWDLDLSRSLLLHIPWEEVGFSRYLKSCLSPRIPIPDLTKKNRLNVAVHVRTLSGGDTVESAYIPLPLKFPTGDYHKRQIWKVYEWNLRQPLHVFFFTDSKDPLSILEEFRRDFPEDIEFGIQELEHADTDHVVEDFFAMQKFDVLIATQSNFSAMASRLRTFDMVFYPVHVTGIYPNARVDRVQVVSRKSAWFPYALNAIFKE